MKEKMKKADKAKLDGAKVSLAEIMENLGPFLPKREIFEPEPSKDWRIQEECTTPAKADRELQEADV
jgi:hypothetical protein